MPKYVIELEETEIAGLYKAKGFNTLFFDEYGIEHLEPYKEKEEEEPLKTYYYIDDSGAICSTVNAGMAMDVTRLEIGNYFDTYAAAKSYVRYCKVQQQLRVFAVPESKLQQGGNYYELVVATSGNGCYEVAFQGISMPKRGNLYFASPMALKRAVDTIGEETVLNDFLLCGQPK